ncbi:MAG: family 10 glycosylhydrolase [Candidatus Latescibacterota bacterium]
MKEPAEACYLLDLSCCEPHEALSRDSRPDAWTMVDYEIAQGPGVMLFAQATTHPLPVTLPLNLKGCYKIYLGIYYGAHAGAVIDRVLKVKLTGDPSYTRIGREDFRPNKDGTYPEKDVKWSDIAEAFWKSADLTGQAIMFSRPTQGQISEWDTNIAYVKLVPLSKSEIEASRKDAPRPDTRRLVANYDGGNIGQWGLRSLDGIREEFECLRDSDFDTALYSVAEGPICYYPTGVGEFIEPCPFPSACSQHLAQAAHGLREAGIDLLAAAIEMAHEVNVKLFPQIRFQTTQSPPQHEVRYHGGQFQADHPEWLARYADGEPTRHLSLAFPEVRRFYVRLFREWAEDYGADGINAIFSRSAPFVYYEEPVLSAFREATGEDVRKVPEEDERILHCRAGFVTQFLREVRMMLDEVGTKQGRTIPTCYQVPFNNTPDFSGTAVEESLFHALDVAAWIKEGLVDDLILHIHAFGAHDGSALAPHIREFVRLAKGTGTKIYADVYPRRMPARAYRKIALSYYQAGADGLSFWDSFTRHVRASEWAFIKKLGHKDDLPGWEGLGDDWYRAVPMRSLDGYRMGRTFSLPTDG